MAEPVVFAGYPEEKEKPFDVKYHLFLFKKNLTVILTFLIITVTLASIYVSKMPRIYRSETQLVIERPGAAQTWDAESMGPADAYTADYYNTQREIIRSSAVLSPVIQELKLMEYFGVKNEEQAIRILRDLIVTAARVGESRLFTIAVETPDPQLSASLANSVARSYIRKNFEDMLYFSKEILGWLPQQGNPNETMAVEDPFGQVKQITRDELLESLPSIQTDPGIRALREKKFGQESELGVLLRQYREKHPLVVKARANLKFIDDSLQSEKVRVLEKLKNRAEGRYQAGHARILEEAKPAKDTIEQNRLKIILIAAGVELLLSLLLIALLDHFDDTIRSADDLERKGLVLPFLGHVPIIKVKMPDQEKALAAYFHKQSEVAESFRYLRVAINFSATPEELKALVLASCLPHEGKSFLSHNLAVSFALDGNKTLLVDGDLRRPVVHQSFRVENGSGLSNYLTSDVTFDSVIRESFVENLSIVTSGPMSPNPGIILGSKRMQAFYQEARKRFDRVIFDCPPLTGLGDAYVIGNLVGQIILVIGAGKTPVDLVRHNQKQLDKSNVKILGLILNMLDLEKERYGGYAKHYYHTYTRYYGNSQRSSA